MFFWKVVQSKNPLRKFFEFIKNECDLTLLLLAVDVWKKHDFKENSSFLKNFLKGFLLWTTFFIFSVFKNFFKAFLLWTTLQKKWRFLCFGKSRVSSSRFQKIKVLKSITFHRFSMVLKTVLIGFEPILRRQNDFCHCAENSFVRTAS